MRLPICWAARFYFIFYDGSRSIDVSFTRAHTHHTLPNMCRIVDAMRGQQKSWPTFVDAIALALAYSVHPCLGVPCHVFVYASMLIMCPCINERSALATHAARPCLPDKKQTDRTSNEQNILLFFLPLSLALFSLSAALTRNLCRTVNFTTNYKLNIENRRRTFFAYYLSITFEQVLLCIYIHPARDNDPDPTNKYFLSFCRHNLIIETIDSTPLPVAHQNCSFHLSLGFFSFVRFNFCFSGVW